MRISPPARSQFLHPPGARRGVQVQRCATQPAVSKRHRLACDMGGLSILSGSRDRRMASIGSAGTPRERSSLLARSRSRDTDEVPITHCTTSSHAHFVLSFYHLSTSFNLSFWFSIIEGAPASKRQLVHAWKLSPKTCRWGPFSAFSAGVVRPAAEQGGHLMFVDARHQIHFTP